MKNDKVDVLLSVYNPDKDYLAEQLRSLDEQTYENMEIIIFDDCVENRCDLSIFEENLKKKKFKVLPYINNNMGYVKAFEHLVQESEGDWIAFCDQDDIWDASKIEKCIIKLKQEKTVLVVSDRKLIDGDGKVICESVRHNSNKNYETWNSYEDIGVCNFFTACAPGMSIVVCGGIARRAIPFSVNTGHDKWIIGCANACGKVSYLDETLVCYRRHGKNVSGILEGIENKKDYEQQRIIPHLELVKEFKERYPFYQGNEKALQFAEARKMAPNKLMELVIKILKKRK